MDNQHGFAPKRVSLTNLTEFVSFCKRNLDSGGQVDVIYTDLKADFDLISHDILIANWQKLKFSEQIVKWLHSYLTERSYKIKNPDPTRTRWTTVSELISAHLPHNSCCLSTYKRDDERGLERRAY